MKTDAAYQITQRAVSEIYRLMAEGKLPLSQKHAAKKIGVTEFTIHVWQIGSSVPSALSLQKLMLCGADILYILGGNHDHD